MSCDEVPSSFRGSRRASRNFTVMEMEFFSPGRKRALISYSGTEMEGDKGWASSNTEPSGRDKALTTSCCRTTDTETDEKEAGTTALPEEVVEKIVAMMPFTSLFKARGLSKSWLARFSSISSFSQADEEKKRLATSFQKQVSEWSYRWTTFCPTFIGKEDILAYDHKSKLWHRLASLSFLPESMLLANRNSYPARSYYQIEGSLLYGFARTEIGFYRYEMYVANIWTRTWKQLPPRPKAGLSFVLCNKLVCNRHSNSYKVVLFCQDDCLDEFDQFSAQIYDSKSEEWSTQKFVVPSEFSVSVGPSTCAYLDGILYMVAVTNLQNLLAFNLAKGTLEEIKLSFDEKIEIVSVDLMVCNANRLVMVTAGVHPDQMQILKVDLPSKRLVQLSRGPPAPYSLGKISAQPVSDGNGNHIYFRIEDHGAHILAYNLDEKEWRNIPIPPAARTNVRTYRWIGSSCHPGLNPFVAV